MALLLAMCYIFLCVLRDVHAYNRKRIIIYNKINFHVRIA